MAYFALRFDLRNPPLAGTSMQERYRAALEMTEWADRLGFVSVTLSEHHGSDDGYLPSPVAMAAAIAARTETIRIHIAALVAAFHDPLRLAEDLAVVDLVSGGRLDVVITNGYVAREFAMFGQPVSERARRTAETVATLRRAWTGEPFEFRGRTARVLPTPAQPGGPRIVLGGSSEAAARRAARIGDGFTPSTAEVWDFYRDEVVSLGRPDPGPYGGGDTSFFHLATDPDDGWGRIGAYALHEANSYGQWMADGGVGAAGGYVPMTDLDALRASGQYRVMTPGELAAQLRDQGPHAVAVFHPMMGGIPPDVAWSSLRLFEHEVLPLLDQPLPSSAPVGRATRGGPRATA
jgi:alkanesulfonate monooxygenase SsuD/methylene tetrahydromethanopterin reductase-like flavin-dependent oxidoreductase (luciferase family)